MTIFEPATLITDALLAVLGFALAAALRRRGGLDHSARLWWHRALVTMAVGAGLGGLYHGFAPNFPAWVDGVWWRLVLMSISLVGLTMGMSLTHELGLDRRWHRLVWLKYLATTAAILIIPNFVVAILDYGSAMMLWLVAALAFRRHWSSWMVAAVLLSAVAAGVQQSGLSLDPRFNHNDLFHVIQAVALFGFFQAGMRFRAAWVTGNGA